MKLLLVRHAAAVPRGTPGVPDDERPLTPEGKAKAMAREELLRVGPTTEWRPNRTPPPGQAAKVATPTQGDSGC